MKGKIKILVFGIIIILFFRNAGCFQLVDGPMQFNIEGFEEFFEIESPEKGDEYIDSGKLDFYKREEVLIIPFIKEISDDQCVILILPYSKNANTTLYIDKISLITADGYVINCIEEYGNVAILSNYSHSMQIVDTFYKSEEWFYSGNNLVLHINARVKKGNRWIPIQIAYNITTRGTRGPAWQV